MEGYCAVRMGRTWSIKTAGCQAEGTDDPRETAIWRSSLAGVRDAIRMKITWASVNRIPGQAQGAALQERKVSQYAPVRTDIHGRDWVTFPPPGTLTDLDLTALDRYVAELTAQAQAYVSEINRIRRDAIHATVESDDWTGEAASRRRIRVQAIAERLGISVTHVYQVIRQSSVEHLG